MTGESFIDVDFCHRPKRGQVVSGDVFLSRKIKGEGRIVSVLSDGLGSGVKASVLANLTASMALRYATSLMDVRKSAATIMDTLPICEKRRISYSTFTLVDLYDTGRATIIEHGNPPAIILRQGEPVEVGRQEVALEGWNDRTLRCCEFELKRGDRIICCSDGISQSGLGDPGLPFGWGVDSLTRSLSLEVGRDPEISARNLAKSVVAQAYAYDRSIAKDDMTCGVVYFRHPRKLLILTGPPFARERDSQLAELARDYSGRKAVCGGTTANIVSRLLNRSVDTPLTRLDPEIPPASRMEGIDLVTEGTMTLARVAEMLEHPEANWPDNAAGDLVSLMRESDIVDFVVGTRINEAHQDPNVPVELDLRRNIVRKIASLLESRCLKETSVRFV
jgi:hypothetical protein